MHVILFRHLNTQNTNLNLVVRNNKIKQVYKNSGCYIDKYLFLSSHMKYLLSKRQYRLEAMKTIRPFLNRESLLALYYYFFTVIFNVGHQGWPKFSEHEPFNKLIKFASRKILKNCHYIKSKISRPFLIVTLVIRMTKKRSSSLPINVRNLQFRPNLKIKTKKTDNAFKAELCLQLLARTKTEKKINKINTNKFYQKLRQRKSSILYYKISAGRKREIGEPHTTWSPMLYGKLMLILVNKLQQLCYKFTRTTFGLKRTSNVNDSMLKFEILNIL